MGFYINVTIYSILDGVFVSCYDVCVCVRVRVRSLGVGEFSILLGFLDVCLGVNGYICLYLCRFNIVAFVL